MGIAAARAEHLRRGIIYLLTAISMHRRGGAYPESFDGLVVSGLELPDGLVTPGRKMLVVSRPAPPTDHDVTASAQDGTLPELSRSAEAAPGEGIPPTKWIQLDFLPRNDSDRIRNRWRGQGLGDFQLPDFQAWDSDSYGPWHDTAGSIDSPSRFMAQVELTPKQTLSSLTFPRPTDSPSRSGSEVVRDVLVAGVRLTLEVGDRDQQIATIKALQEDVRWIGEFVPELTSFVSGDNLDVACAAAEALSLALRQGGVQPSDLAADLELSAHDDGSRPGVPILNPSSGHAYEVTTSTEPVSWYAAQSESSRRRWRGRSGHLATITSPQENDFLLRLLGGTDETTWLWLGAADLEDVGVWKWVCGPEQGLVFDVVGEDPQGYQNWQSGEPASLSLGQFLVLDAANSTGHGRGKWRKFPAPGFNSVHGYVVEYSPPAPADADSVGTNPSTDED